MRSAILLPTLLFLSFFAQAQTEPGRGLWSASLQIQTVQLSGDYPSGYTRRDPEIVLSLSHGVFLNNNWLVGGSVTGSYFKQVDFSNTSSLEQRYWRGGLSAFVRKYWGQNQWRVYVGGGIGGSVDQLNRTISTASGVGGTETSALSYQVAPFTQLGGVYFLNSRWGFELSTTSTVFPFSFSGLTAGLVYMTGSTEADRAIQAATPPTEGTQTRAGRFAVGGSLAYSGVSNEENGRKGNGRSLSFSPSIGLFVADNLLVGIGVPFSLDRISADGASGQSTTKTSQISLGFAPFVRAYLSSTRLRPYVGLTALYSSYSYKQDPFPREKINSTISGTLHGGLAYLLGRHFIAEANLLNLSLSKQTQNNQQKNGLWIGSIQVTSVPGFSVRYVF
ncbi:hypothetical protein [Larkinella soli]|uniref:hypothetical protein n=1 Tax=Larkinella soli TaxID=1770527 RepID=UPI000FFBA113|nr:hypothetical protein [Larkinella soli]